LHHVEQHPRGRDAALGRRADQDLVDEALTVEVVGLAGEDAAVAVDVIPRAEPVARHQRLSLDDRSHTRPTAQDHDVTLHRHPPNGPRTAAATHSSVGRNTGLYPYPAMMFASFDESVRIVR